jgi:hypothetical protein
MKSVLTSLMIFFCMNIFGQINLQVKDLTVYNAKIKMPKNMLIESLEKGPSILGVLIFKNITDSVITLLPFTSRIILNYVYNTKEYSIEINSILFMSEEFVEVRPGQTIKVDFFDYLFLGTDILKFKDYDYTKEILVIVPKIQIYYIDKKFKIKSDVIKDYKISEN